MHTPTKTVLLSIALGFASACTEEDATAADPASFLAPIGQIVAPICTADNSDKRFTLEGYVGLPNSLNVDDAGNANVDFFAAGPGTAVRFKFEWSPTTRFDSRPVRRESRRVISERARRSHLVLSAS